MIFIELLVRGNYAQALPATWISSRMSHVAADVEMTTSPCSWLDEIKVRHLLNIYEHNTRTKTLIKYVTLWVFGFADCVASYFFGVSHSSARAAPHRLLQFSTLRKPSLISVYSVVSTTIHLSIFFCYSAASVGVTHFIRVRQTNDTPDRMLCSMRSSTNG